MNPITELVQEYRKTRRKVQLQARELDETINEKKKQMKLTLESIDESEKIDFILEQKDKISKLKTLRKALSEDISNLNYAIDWMVTAKQPGSTRGIENRAAYKRNVKLNSEWIKHQSYQEQDLEELEGELLKEMESINLQQKQFIKSILSSLTTRQKEVLELVANGHNQPEIAEMLGVSQQAISETIQRCMAKIKSEGWIML